MQLDRSPVCCRLTQTIIHTLYNLESPVNQTPASNSNSNFYFLRVSLMGLVQYLLLSYCMQGGLKGPTALGTYAAEL